MFWVLIEMVLLSTHNICFGCEIRKIIFGYALLTKCLLHPLYDLLSLSIFLNVSCKCSDEPAHIVKNCLKRPPKIEKTKVLKTKGRLMKDESIAECSLGAFCNTFDLH